VLASELLRVLRVLRTRQLARRAIARDEPLVEQELVAPRLLEDVGRGLDVPGPVAADPRAVHVVLRRVAPRLEQPRSFDAPREHLREKPLLVNGMAEPLPKGSAHSVEVNLELVDRG